MTAQDRFALIALFLCSAPLLQAQVGVGVRAGINGTYMTLEEELTNTTIETDYLYRYNYALLFQLPLSDRLSLQPEISYIQKGFSYELPSLPIIGQLPDLDLIVDYLEIPLLLNYTLGEDLLGIFVEAGPTLRYALAMNTEFGNIREELDLTQDEINRLEIGATAGLGVQINTIFGSAFVYGRHLYGFTSLNGSAEDIDGSFGQHQSFNAGLGYLVYF